MKNIVKNLQDGFIKYHGCGVCRRDGTNVLITKKNPCYNPINKFEHETMKQMTEYMIQNL